MSSAGSAAIAGPKLVDWDRLHVRDFGDVEYTFAALKNEMIRHYFFHRELDEKAVRHAQRKGRIRLKEAARHRLGKYLAPAQPARDGRQTPFQGNAIFYAQHATATCCRTCLEYWHNIPKGRELSGEEQAYCAALVDCFLDERLPGLAKMSIRVANMRRVSAAGVVSVCMTLARQQGSFDTRVDEPTSVETGKRSRAQAVSRSAADGMDPERTGIDARSTGMTSNGLLVCVSGKIGSGKTWTSVAIAKALGFGYASFGGYVRDRVVDRGGDPDCRELLQDVGQSLGRAERGIGFAGTCWAARGSFRAGTSCWTG